VEGEVSVFTRGIAAGTAVAVGFGAEPTGRLRAEGGARGAGTMGSGA